MWGLMLPWWRFLVDAGSRSPFLPSDRESSTSIRYFCRGTRSGLFPSGFMQQVRARGRRHRAAYPVRLTGGCVCTFLSHTSCPGVVSSPPPTNDGVSSSQREIAQTQKAPESGLQIMWYSTLNRGQVCPSVSALLWWSSKGERVGI